MKKSKLNMITVFLMFACLPLLVSGIFSIVSAALKARDLCFTEVRHTLQASTDSLRSSIDEAAFYQEDGGFECSSLDKLMDSLLSNSDIYATVFQGDTRVYTSLPGDNQIGTKCSDEVRTVVLENSGNYFAERININGEKYFGYYEPLIKDGNTVGMLFCGYTQEKIDAEMAAFVMGFAGSLAVLMLVCMAAAVMAGRYVRKKIGCIREQVKRLVCGDLATEEVNSQRIAELADIKDDLERLRAALSGIISQVDGLAADTQAAAGEIGSRVNAGGQSVSSFLQMVNGLAQGASSMAGSVQTMAFHMTNISECVESVRKGAGEANGLIADVKKVCLKADKNFGSLAQASQIPRSKLRGMT